MSHTLRSVKLSALTAAVVIGAVAAPAMAAISYDFKAYDANRDGKITEAEFVKVDKQSDAAKVFSGLDKNGDKTLSSEEFSQWAKMEMKAPNSLVKTTK